MGTGKHAAQLLGRQGIMKGEICSAICTALAKGRGKYQNVCIHGLTNRGKSFTLSRLKVIYKRMLRLFISMILFHEGEMLAEYVNPLFGGLKGGGNHR